MTRKGKPLRNLHSGIRGPLKASQQPRLCPTCWNAMKWITKDVFECPKHGKPTRP